MKKNINVWMIVSLVLVIALVAYVVSAGITANVVKVKSVVGGTQVYTKTEVDTKLGKYYNKTQIDTKFANLPTSGSTEVQPVLSDSKILFDADKNKYFVVREFYGEEMYAIRAENFVSDSIRDKTNIAYLQNNGWTSIKVGARNGDTLSLGELDFSIDSVNNAENSVEITITNGFIVSAV